MSTITSWLHETVDHFFPRDVDSLELTVGPDGPSGKISVPSDGDGVWEIATIDGRACLVPNESSHYIYFVLPDDFLGSVEGDLWLEVDYVGHHYAEFRVQYVSNDRSVPPDGLYNTAEQRWSGEASGHDSVRRAVFHLEDFDPARRQNLEACFRVEFRRDVRITRLEVLKDAPSSLDELPTVAPLPELRKMPGRLYPLDYLFIEITNACNFKCTWCPDEIMDRRRGFMKKERAFGLLDEVADKRSLLGPIYPVKLHQMGEPFLHPDLAEIVAHAEARGVGIELNTNCGLITEEILDGLYDGGLTSLILSYQTPDSETFKTRKAPKLDFESYRDKVRFAVDRKFAKGARTRLEIDIMNTKYASGYTIVSEEEQALEFLRDWIEFARGVEENYGLEPREHDWDEIEARHVLDQDEDGSRYELLPGVALIWKRCHSWGNVVGDHALNEVKDTYCPAPYDQMVVHWNGDIVACCTDFEGHTKHSNAFTDSIESIWRGETLKRRKQDMLEGRLLDVCARCQGLK